MSEKVEYVELTVKVPKPVMDLFEAYWRFVGWTDQTAKEYLEQHSSHNFPELVFDLVFERIIDDAGQFIETYGLEAYKDQMGFPVKKDC